MHHIQRQQSRGPNNVASVILPNVPQKLYVVGWMSIHRTVRKNLSYMCVCVCVCLCVGGCICMYVCICVYTHTHIYTYHKIKNKLYVCKF